MRYWNSLLLVPSLLWFLHMCASHIHAQIPTNIAIVGGNIPSASGYNLVFIDAFRSTRKYGLAKTPWVALSDDQYTTDGWPIGTSAGTVLFTENPSGSLSGTYYFQGDGELTLGLISSPYCSIINVTQAFGKTTGYVVVGSSATILMLNFKQATNSTFRNLRLIRPGFTIEDADTQIFHPAFLETIKDLKILRMMDWLGTNANPDTVWGNRSLVTDTT
ncbi:predicted protein [Naegleria gruberi]|uniref:Predicted protein n=1 Tax=Naegleria gruberi TaxID=5762 RepID=D2V4D0_NAEGR|nr:uncharacterized protein NAEGRDRAFT_63682 [Naegleria gruberi]EFC48363.1 predicted protein [Naegleria gruberi]|eukprot:XP_002681107.1 predicted protein [Naegleria gruberi strain NEG-M]